MEPVSPLVALLALGALLTLGALLPGAAPQPNGKGEQQELDLDLRNKTSTAPDDNIENKSIQPNFAEPEAFDPYNPTHKYHAEVGYEKDDQDNNYDDNYDVNESHNSKQNAGRQRELGEDDGDEDDRRMLAPFGTDQLLSPNSDNLPVFLVEPKDTYVIKNKPATLQCKAANALQIYFKCNGERWTGSTQLEFVDPHSGVRILEAEGNVTRDQVEEYFGKERFRCDCIAWTGRGQIRSQPAYVEVAYLRKQFISPPKAISVELYGQTSLRCVPPSGIPPAQLSWLKNGVPLVPSSGSSIIISSEGHIHVSRATQQDMANYTCVAVNVAGKRTSEPALLIVYVNGGWSAWSQWSECRCPGQAAQGQRRTRTCTKPQPVNGGTPCSGPAIQRSENCLPCVNSVSGRWSAWSEWSRCGRDCLHSRRRQCVGGLGPGAEGCLGREVQLEPCASGGCRDEIITGHEVAPVSSNAPLYIALAVASVVFAVVAFFIFRYLKRKGRDRSFYGHPRADVRPQFFQDLDKKSLQPDLMQHSDGPPCYEYPPFVTKPQNTIISDNVAEHHYDVPHLTNNYAIPIDSQIVNSSNESDNYDKKPYCDSEHSSVSCCASSDSTYDATADRVTLTNLSGGSSAIQGIFGDLTPSTCNVSQMVGPIGGRLTLDGVGAALSVPEGAVTKSAKESMSITLIKEDRFRPKLTEGTTQVSPIIRVGPSSAQLCKPVIVQIPHCASLRHGFWNFSLLTLERDTHHKGQPSWRKIISLGEETINTPVYTQLDSENVFLVTESLSTFVLVGESLNGKSVKKLKLAVFGPAVSSGSRPTKDFNIRVYVMEDTPAALNYCSEQEARLSGILLDRPKTLLFQDGGCSLYVSVEDVGLGWKAKSSFYQEIPFSHIWNSSLNSLHCGFVLEQTDSINVLEFKVSASQKMNPSYKQIFNISSAEDFSLISPVRQNRRTYLNSDLNMIVTENALDSKTFPGRSLGVIDEYYESSARHKNLTVNDKGINSCAIDGTTPFRLPKNVKKQLCSCLDPPNARGNDWRLLAQKLNVDRYVNFFATKCSPTEIILDLWECRHRNASAVADLATIFRVMGRTDAVRIIESCLGPSWL